MTKPEDGSWDDATPDDEDARLDGDDHPTIRASDEQLAALRRERMKQRLKEEAAGTERKRATVPGPNKTRAPAPAHAAMSVPRTVTDRGVPVQPNPLAIDDEQANPAITNRGIPVAPVLQDLVADAEIEPRGTPMQSRASGSSAPPPAPVPMPTRGRAPTGDDGVILLDRVSSNAPVGEAPRRSESAAGGVVIVATGADADRIRRLCHAHKLLVPLVSSLAIAHEAMFVVVVGEPAPPAPERVVHVVRPSVPDDLLIDLLRALVSGYIVGDPPTATSDGDPRVHEFAARLAKMEDRGAFEMIAVEAVTKIMGADRAHCMFFDPATGALWSEGVRRTLGDARKAVAGFVGYSAYTGRAIHAEPAGEDPRYLQELDDPEGKPQSRIIVQPIVGADRRTHAVLVAARRWRHLPFAADDVAQLKNLAALVGPRLDVLASGSDGRKPKTTIPGPLKNAQTASIGEPRSRPPSPPPPIPPAARGSQSMIDAPTAPRAPIDPAAVRDPDTDASDSRRLRATRQPPATSTTGRTKVPTGEARRPKTNTDETRPGTPPGTARSKPTTDETRPEGHTPSAELPRGALRSSTPSSGARVVPAGARATPSAGARVATSPGEVTPPSGSKLPLPAPRHPPSSPPTPTAAIPMVHRVAIVAGDDEHDRGARVAKTLGLEIALATTTESAPRDARIVTLGLPWSPDLDPRVTYVARSTISNDHLADLLAAVASGKPVTKPEAALKPGNATEARRIQISVNGSRTFASALDFVTAEMYAIATLRELLEADRAYFLLYDHATGAISSPSRKLTQGDNRRSIAGMAGWVALTGRAAMTERAAADPRWLGPIDDPEGDSNSQLLVQPVVHGQRVTALIVTAKRARRPGFTELDSALAEHYARLVGPLLEMLHQHVETAKMIDTGTVKRVEPSAFSRFVARIKRLFGR